MTCPRCGAETVPGSKFCHVCGSTLAERRSAEGERRVVTVLFCDVKGSTALAESLDPEEWTDIMNAAFAALIEPISRYEGTVVRLLGDAILAFFGAPTAHEDDPERAVLAGIEMLGALAAYRDRLRTERGIADFDIRIGVNTGLAILGDVGSGQRVEYTAMGDAVNVAARLQQMARPGTMVIGETTQRLVASLFDLQALGMVELKGRSTPIAAFEVVRRAARPGRQGGIAGATVPVVGRDAEQRTLIGVLDEVRAGHGRIVSLIGEPGIGKSRLIDELRSGWQAGAGGGRARWSDARCESYSGSQAYLVFRPTLFYAIGASPSDPPPLVRERIDAVLVSQPEDVRERGRRVLEGVLGTGEIGAAGLEGEALAAEIRRVVVAMIRWAVRDGPTVFAFDDLHWSDASSGDLLVELFALTDELPILFLCGSRPDRRSVGWRLKQSAESDYPHRYREVLLSPLRPAEGGALIARILDPNDLPSALCDLIAAKGEGNPFFLQEIIRSLVDRGTIRKDQVSGIWRSTSETTDVSLPETLHGVLSARIDRLDESARRTLQAASVIGRTFPYRVLAAVAEADGRLDKDLATLQRFELVSETARVPEREFTFRHALTQDAAYGSILQRRRRELHGRVGEALLAIRADRLDEEAGIIGQHLAQAGDPRSAALLVRAGDRARRLYALDEALAHYDRALAQVKHADTKLLVDLYTGRGRALEMRGQHDEAIASYEDLRRTAIERGDREVEGNALAMLASIYSTATAKRDVAKAGALLGRALEIARERDDRALVASLQKSHMWLAYFSGDLAGATAAGEEAVAIERARGKTDELAVALNNVQHVYRDSDRFAEAEAAGREATEIFRARGNKLMLADSLSTRSQALLVVGDYDGVLRLTDEARSLSAETRNPWGLSYADYVSPFVLYERGNHGDAVERWRACLENARRGGFAAAGVGAQSELASLFRDIGAYELATIHIEASLDVARRVLPGWLKWPLAQRARIEVAMGDLDAARGTLAETDRLPPGLDRFAFVPAAHTLARASLALAVGDATAAAEIAEGGSAYLERRGILPWRTDLLLLAGQAREASGDHDGSRRALQLAQSIAERLGSKRTLWRILAALRERRRAGEITAEIAASLEPVGRRETFEALPEVRALSG